MPGAIHKASKVLASILGALFLVHCSDPSEPRQTSAKSQGITEERKTEERKTKERKKENLEEKAWADASGLGTVQALQDYLTNHGSGPHVSEARQRLAALEEQARKDAEEKAWTQASHTDTVEALIAYLKTHGSGGHAAEARQRLAALEEKARRDAEEKAWTDASAIGTVEAITRYLKDHASSAHAAQARQQLAALEEQARKDEEKAWADASSAGTIGAIVKYLKDHASSDYAGEARQRLAALEEQARKQNERLLQQKALRVGIPPINIRNTCRAASVVARDTTPGTDEACIKTELSARDSIVEQWSGFIATEKAMCINRNVYLPSYVEWLTCLELHRDVRKMRQQPVQALEKRQPRKRR